jgi:hypothetical protein
MMARFEPLAGHRKRALLSELTFRQSLSPIA